MVTVRPCALLIAALCSAACGDRAAVLLGAACPCVEGYVCCASTQTCALASVGCRERLSVTSVAPTAGPAEGGGSLTLRGAGFGDGLEVRVGGVACVDVVVEDSATASCRVPAGPAGGGSVDVAVRAADGDAVNLPGAYTYLRPWFRELTASAVEAAPPGRGAALADVDGDGALELWLADDDAPFVGPVTWRWTGGDFEPAPLASPAVPGHAGVSVFDLVGDGAPELQFAGSRGRDTLGVLNGSRSPAVVVEAPELEVRGFNQAVPVDLDGDGRLEAVGCMRFDEFPEEGRMVVLEASDGRLVRRVGPSEGAFGAECQVAVAADFDLDGDPDVAACGGFFGIWENRDGRLVRDDASLQLVPEPCVALSAVDWDGDGDLDLASVAGGDVDVGNPRGPASGVTLYRNVSNAALRFEAVGALDLDPPSTRCRLPEDAPRSTASLRYGARSAAWLDVDHDGDVDAFLPLPSLRCGLGPGLLLNRYRQGEAGFRFVLLSGAGLWAGATATVRGDIDGDGDQDLVVHAEAPSTPRVLLSQTVDAALPERRALRVRPLDGGRPAWGATVRVWEGAQEGEGRVQVRALTVGGNLAQPEPLAHFGLGTHDGPVTVRVDFAPGVATSRTIDRETTTATTVEIIACRGDCENGG